MRNLVASTMPEVWGVLESGLIEEGKIDDVSERETADSDSLLASYLA